MGLVFQKIYLIVFLILQILLKVNFQIIAIIYLEN